MRAEHSCFPPVTGSLLSNFKQLYDVVNSTIEATLSDSSAVVNIRGFTSNGVGVALDFNGTFWSRRGSL
ncbi:hypothetical protein PILCRDRAFT_222000 [Piloderma croceum F 1598]|uniref:Uncharacterized protein n=1 Tax=Piloderma croceum (strain F 1598) TaxID=765440 RepID=A0A0C3FYR0_PILCF|nr:hypothetical protein PILCRDRAFT_222000 [Piloderma croceum F 1598]